ncbi:MAG TPA: FAD-dependent monooxygenase [Candidatus Elarobacter sp.]|nr:FAD-dependent monooxygenase [Candidatus Elarobacter sp.]
MSRKHRTSAEDPADVFHDHGSSLVTMTNGSTERLLIVGGGIGGLATALALARHGVATEVAEQAAEFREIGAGLQLAPNASWALSRLGVLEQVNETAVFPARMVWMDALSGEPLTSLDLGAPFRKRYGFPYFVMHRSDLLDALVRACETNPLITLTTDKTFVSLKDHGEFLEAHFRDGTSVRARGLIGADGLKSRVRQCVLDDGEPICSGYVAYRGAIPIADVSVHAGLDNVVLWTGPDMHFVQYPLRRGELYNQVAVFKSDRYASGAADWGTEDELEARFSAGAPLLRAALTRIKRDRRWPMYDRLPAKSWTRNRVTLIGDAAHPMLQYLAQGACQALEDAVVLADSVASAGDTDLDEAFRRYEAARVDRTARVQTLARAWGDYWHMHPGADLDRRNSFLRSRRPEDYTDTDWFYAYRG